jgi:hypothetical protein
MKLRLALTVFLAVMIVIASFAFFTPHANKNVELAPVAEKLTITLPNVRYSDTYKKGIHTINGSVSAPTPCTELSASLGVASGTPELISVTLLMPRDTGICLQRSTTLPFTVSTPASAKADIEILVNGMLATSTRIAP